MNHLRTLTCFVAASLLAAACGGESNDEAVVDAVTRDLVADETFQAYEIQEAEARCAAESMVDDLGTDRMEELGFTTSEEETADNVDFADLNEEEVGVLAEAMEDCIDDIDEVLVDSVAAGILEEPDPNFPVDEPQARCVAEDMVEGISLQRLIVIGLQSDGNGSEQFSDLSDEETETFTQAFINCLDVRQILLDGMAANGVSDEVLACLDQEITDDDIEALFVAGFAGDDSDAAAEEILTPAIETCL